MLSSQVHLSRIYQVKVEHLAGLISRAVRVGILLSPLRLFRYARALSSPLPLSSYSLVVGKKLATSAGATSGDDRVPLTSAYLDFPPSIGVGTEPLYPSAAHEFHPQLIERERSKRITRNH